MSDNNSNKEKKPPRAPRPKPAAGAETKAPQNNVAKAPQSAAKQQGNSPRRPQHRSAPKPAVKKEEPQALTTAPAAPARQDASPAPKKRSRRNSGKSEKRLPPVRIIPLGGLGEIGKNMTVYECQGDMFIVDCGLAFPDESMLGVDLVIPDFTFVLENADRIRGVVLTHGHEDHIGGLAYLLKQVNLPIYGTRLTIGLVEGKLKEHGLLSKSRLNVVAPRDVIKMGCMSVEFINVNHSIPDACALAIETPAGLIVQTGDFKVDYTPILGEIIDLARFGELGSKGVLALLSDSTNAERSGSTASERTVGDSFDKLFAQAADKRILVATFASNIHRVQQIINASVKFGRKVAVSGRSMENVVAKALEIGYLDVPKGVLIEMDSIGRYPAGKVAIITTGSQGEPMSALTRMAMGEHRKVKVTPTDYIIISATPIPGNEKLVTRVVNELLKLGAEVIYENIYEIHVSGHACQDELRLMLGLTKPKFFIPVHGEYKHLKKHAAIGVSMGIDPKNVFIPEIGKVIETNGAEMKFNGSVTAGRVLVDGLGVGDVGSIVLRDRKHLAQDGLIVVVTTMDTANGQIMAGPDIVSRGFVYVRESEDMIAQARDIARSCIQKCIDQDSRDWTTLKTRLKDDIGDFLWQKTKRSPMILPVIQEV